MYTKKGIRFLHTAAARVDADAHEVHLVAERAARAIDALNLPLEHHRQA